MWTSWDTRALFVGVYPLPLLLGLGGRVWVGFGEGERGVIVETRKEKSITP